MKKQIKAVLCISLALVIALALASCGESGSGSGGSTEVGTWELTELAPRTIDQGKLLAASHSTITTFSDNTFVLTEVQDTLYSSDGGETYNPTSYVNIIVHGKYETVSTDAELGESTIKITEITRVQQDDIDTDKAASDSDKQMMADCSAVGMEIILGADYKMSQIVPFDAFYYIGRE